MIIEKDRVVLAADSLVTDDSHHRQLSKCKIHQAGSFFYAISGISVDPETGFDPDTLIAKHKKDINGKSFLDAIGGSLLGPLQKELTLIRKETPARYSKIIQSRLMESVFVIDTFENKREGYLKEFRVMNGIVTTTPARNCLGIHRIEAGERCTSILNMDTLSPFLTLEPGKKYDIIPSIHKIMEAAERAMPKDVGAPISILDLEPGGPQWLEKGLCKEIKEIQQPARVQK
jgi:hypothetical protein